MIKRFFRSIRDFLFQCEVDQKKIALGKEKYWEILQKSGMRNWWY